MSTQLLHNNLSRRSGIDRRQISYNIHIPERRSGKDRRSGLERRLKQRPYNKLMK